jgi:hypothetical protein
MTGQEVENVEAFFKAKGGKYLSADPTMIWVPGIGRILGVEVWERGSSDGYDDMKRLGRADTLRKVNQLLEPFCLQMTDKEYFANEEDLLSNLKGLLEDLKSGS